MAARTGLFGMRTPGAVAVAVIGAAGLGLVGYEIYKRSRDAAPETAVIGGDTAENSAASQPRDPAADPASPATGESPPTGDSVADAPDGSPDTAADSAAAPDSTAEASDNTTDPTPTDDAAPPALVPPAFDVVRVEPDGTGVIAGTGPAEGTVTLYVDEVEQETVEVTGSGKFVAFLSLEISDRPRLLTLRARREGLESWARDQIILAPGAGAPASAPDRLAADTTASDVIAEAATVDVAATDDSADDTTAAITTVATETGGGTGATTASETETVATAALSSADAPSQGGATTGPDAMAAAPSGPGDTATGRLPQTPGAEGTAPDFGPDIAAAGQPPAGSAGPADPQANAQSDPAPRPRDAAAPVSPEAPGAPDAPGTEPRDFAAPDSRDAPGGVSVLRAGADGVELIQPGTPDRPEALDRLALDTISYSDSGEVLLAGRAPEGTAVRVYLDNRPVADLPIAADGHWRGEVPGIRPGVYTLRLDQVSDDGRVGGRLETPFKREAASVLAAARSDLPADSAAIAAVTVQRGDTLWAISQDRYGSGFLYVRVFEANRDSIRDPDLIYPGQVFAIPN